MGIESTYSMLSGQQRARQKKEERNKLLLTAGNMAINTYNTNLAKERETFSDDADLTNNRIKYQEGLNLYNNKIKSVYDQGTNSLEGLGEYLVKTVARPMAEERFNGNINEDSFVNADDLGGAMDIYARELVYGETVKGKDGAPDTKTSGILQKLENLYAKGQTLVDMDKYDEFVSKRADLPENVGTTILNKLVRGKDNATIFTEAKARVLLKLENEAFVKNGLEMKALTQAFNAGLSIPDVEALATNIKSRVEGFDKKQRKLISSVPDTRTREIGGNKITYSVLNQTYENADGTLDFPVEADPSDPLSAKFINNETVQINVEKEEEYLHAITGVKIKATVIKAVNMSGTTLGAVHTNKKEVLKQPSEATQSDPVSTNNIRIAEENFNDVLKRLPQSSRDKITPYLEKLGGTDQTNEKKKAVLQGIYGRTFKNGYNVAQQHGFDPELSQKIATQITLNNMEYTASVGLDNANYSGANIVANTEINGYRVIEALNDLYMSDPELKIEMSEEELGTAVIDALQQGNLGFKSRSDTDKERFTAKTRDYFFKKNAPTKEQLSTDGGKSNLFTLQVMRQNGEKTTVFELMLENARRENFYGVSSDGTTDDKSALLAEDANRIISLNKNLSKENVNQINKYKGLSSDSLANAYRTIANPQPTVTQQTRSKAIVRVQTKYEKLKATKINEENRLIDPQTTKVQRRLIKENLPKIEEELKTIELMLGLQSPTVLK